MLKNKRSKGEVIRRYTTFTISLFFISLGVSLITRSLAGTSPISSIPYVMSLNTALSMGTFILILNMLLIVGQIAMLGLKGARQCRWELLLQLPVSVVFGLFIDLTMALLDFWQPDIYWHKMASLILGCVSMAMGVSLEVIADVAMVSGEYFVHIASRRFKKEFGTVKIMFDVSLVIIAVVCSWMLADRIDGIREGTLITALLTGPMVRLFMPRLAFVRRWQHKDSGDSCDAGSGNKPHTSHPLITIGREYGSGGHDIGRMVADKLGIPFYDNAMMEMVARESGYSEETVRDLDQRLPHSLLYEMVMQDFSVPIEKSVSKKDALFVAQSRVIRRLASQGPCVIVGRCSDAVLHDFPNVINVFLRADATYKVKRAVSDYGIKPGDAAAHVSRINILRSNHYLYYTGKKWGAPDNYHAIFNTSGLTATVVADAIVSLYKSRAS